MLLFQTGCGIVSERENFELLAPPKVQTNLSEGGRKSGFGFATFSAVTPGNQFAKVRFDMVTREGKRLIALPICAAAKRE